MRLGGASEVAAELGVSRQRVSQLRNQVGFPEPLGEIAAGLIWDLDAVATWGRSSLRGAAGRPSGIRRLILNGRYRLEPDALGSGGFADVYRATDLTRDSGPGAVVAIKMLRDFDHKEIRRRFKRELRIVADLNHPHIVPILDQGEDDNGRLWYAMPLAKGSLAEVSDDFVGDDERILRVMRQLCDGLAHVHKQGIYHRDLKPANVLRIASDTWAISDFGLAREAERLTTALTSTLQGVGTFFYAAPEAWKGAKFAEEAADIYSLGKIVLELVTGELPLDSVVATGRFRTIIQKATRHQPDQRYRSVAEFLTALEGAAAAPDRWDTDEEIADQLTTRIRGEEIDEAALRELLDRVLGSDKRDDIIRSLRHTIPLIRRPSLAWLWKQDPDSLTELLEAFGSHVQDTSWDFGFCDNVADFFEMAVLVTASDHVAAVAIESLIELGESHNRWHVQDVAISLLQRVRSTDTALTVVEALRQARPSAVRWTLSDFVIRSLHPTLRDEAARIVDGIS